ncbi:TPA: class I SAM-dependent methyltransferase [Candidatus Poribacteria bacterium]|nr:class I SAM-dependent methyltransferase [Candidatus Poribacteria bacterium]
MKPTFLPKDLTEELCFYLQSDKETIQKKLEQGTFLLADEWRKRNPKTPAEIRTFYCETENYLFELTQWHLIDSVRFQTQRIVQFCRQVNLHSLLNYGCGIGEEGIALAEAGFDVTLADVPGKTFAFAKWRVQQRGLKMRFIEIEDDAPLQDIYDGIICLEVLEHLLDPCVVLRHFYEHLASNGYLFVTATFVHSETHPMHLAKNNRYQGEEFLKVMDELGFERAGFGPMIFRKRG